MSDSLIRNLRDLASCAHADLSVADEAADEIERLRKENQELKLQYLSDQGQWIEETGRLREALRKCLPIMRKAHDRIHCLPRTSDTDLAETIDITLGVVRAALGEGNE